MSRCKDEPPSKKAKPDDDRPVCPYGEKCYRKNPAHFKEFNHKKVKEIVTQAAPVDTSQLPDCPFGANCYRRNLLHFAEYAHPCKAAGPLGLGAGDSDTDVCDSDGEQVSAEAEQERQRVLKRGPSLVKNFSEMSEEERRRLVEQAMEAKKQLEDELDQTRSAAEEKNRELGKLREEMRTGQLLMDGEREAWAGDEIKRYNLIAERDYKGGSAAQMHYRLAESQFYRLLGANLGHAHKVKSVEYIVNPPLVKKFQKAQEDLKRTRGEEYSHPVLAFHGTDVKNIDPILEGGFKMPGSKDYKHKSGNTGAYGYGVYFSEYPSYSMGYISGSTKLLLSKVLQGKVYTCKTVELGAALHKGYDSHTSPCKKEIVIFDSAYILPCYVVHYESSIGEFKYQKPDHKKKKLLTDNELMKRYWKASRVKVDAKATLAEKAKYMIFGAQRIKFVGKLCDTHARLQTLIERFGALKEPPKTAGAVVAPVTGMFGFGGVFGAYGGGTYTPPPAFQVLVTTPEDYTADENSPTKNPDIQQAKTHQIPILREDWVYDSIVELERQDPLDYSLS